jgi:hypothetical protein
MSEADQRAQQAYDQLQTMLEEELKQAYDALHAMRYKLGFDAPHYPVPAIVITHDWTPIYVIAYTDHDKEPIWSINIAGILTVY